MMNGFQSGVRSGLWIVGIVVGTFRWDKSYHSTFKISSALAYEMDWVVRVKENSQSAEMLLTIACLSLDAGMTDEGRCSGCEGRMAAYTTQGMLGVNPRAHSQGPLFTEGTQLARIVCRPSAFFVIAHLRS